MRVLQIIDSLDAGGAERMAVNYANALADKIEFSGIIVTRKEGALKNQLGDKVAYYFLNKKSRIDIKAIKLLKRIVIQNDIHVIHAHGTSFFTAFLLKTICFKIKIVFHEHNGDRSNQSFLKNLPLFICLFFFTKILVVNKQIESWFHQIGIKKASYFPNFASLESNDTEKTFLNGQEGKRIVCLANLREPKNHSVLLKAFAKLNLKEAGWSLHFVGKNHQDNYAENIIKLIKELNILDSVYLYDSKSDISYILSQATMGVLCSTYEGFPVTLLEYGLGRLPVISSNVGFCSELIIHNETGFLFKSNDVDDLALNINNFANNLELRTKLSTNLNVLVNDNYGKEKVVSSLVSIYKTVINED